MTGTLGDRKANRDAQRFVGRSDEIARLQELLEAEEPAVSIVLVHGRGGLGKSTLLREVGRRAVAAGRELTRIDGRDLGPLPEALDDAFAPAFRDTRPVVVLDTYEAMTALGRYLRAAVLPMLPLRALVVIAGRREPESAWFQDGWEHVVEVMRLEPLGDEDAREMLAAHGVDDPVRAAALAAWSDGSPLALALAGAAEVVGARRVDRSPQARRHGTTSDEPKEDAVDALVRTLVDAEVDPGQRAVLGVAAIARITTTELLADVLPGRDAERDLAWLAGRTFADPKATGVRLHDLAGRAVHAALRRQDPLEERTLRRRIAEHLHARAIDGHIELSIDLAHLVEDPVIRWGYGWDGSQRRRVDDVRAGDAAIVEEVLTTRSSGDWWRSTARWFAEAPACIFVVRDTEERLCGYATAMTPVSAPAFAFEDPVVGPWLAHAEAAGGEAVVWRDSIDFAMDPRAPVQAMLGLAGVLRSGLANPRYAYMPTDTRMPDAVAFADALGAVHLPDLDPPGTALSCRRIDYGPGGLLGVQLEVVYREVGYRPTPAPQVAEAIGYEVVRDALRDLQVPHRLATSVLAEGEGTEQRAASVRDRLRRAADEAFGSTEDERMLLEVLTRGYFDPAPSHELAADALHYSRSAYFRRLRAATERLAEHLSR